MSSCLRAFVLEPSARLRKRSLLRAEGEDRPGIVGLPGTQLGRREVLLIGGIREMLRLEAEAGAQRVDVPALALDRPVEEVPGIELDARLGRADLERAAALRVGDARGEVRAGTLPVQAPVVIVALAVLQLRIVLVDARADRGGLPEVERGARDRGEL